MVYIGWYGFIGPTTSTTDISLRDIHVYVYHKYLDTLNTFNMLYPLNRAEVIFKGSI